MKPEEQRLLDSAERQMLQFARIGDRMIFGRLEGIAEALEILGLTEAREALTALSNKHHDAMAKQTGN